MKDILGSEYNTLKASEDPEQLFTFLETIMSEVEATRLLKQVLADLNYWPQFSDRSFRDIIQAYEDKTKEFEDRFGSSRDEYFVGRENEIIKIKKHLTSVSKGKHVTGALPCERLHAFLVFSVDISRKHRVPSVRV